MSKLHPLAFATLTLPLLLAACGSASTPVATGGDLVDLTLNSGLKAIASQGLKTQGLPTNGTVSAVTFIKVNVRDANGTLVTFDGSNVYKPGGTQTFITLSNSTPTAKLLLPKGTYSFENIGKETAAGQFLAYGQDTGIDLSAKNPSVNLTLHTLINAANSTLASKLPTTYVNTTDKLDLRLAVKTPSATLDVPLSDYTVTYSNADATVLTSSKLGANVQVVGTTTQTSVSVDATVNGYVATGAETAAVQNQKVTYTVPLSGTGLSTDATPPTVTFNPVTASPNTAMTLSGTANDNKAISQVRVFDGSVLIGSTNADDVTAGATLITFTGTTWSFNWTSGSVAPDPTVVASDAAGNESRATPSSPVPAAGQGSLSVTSRLPEVYSSGQYGQQVGLDRGGAYTLAVTLKDANGQVIPNAALPPFKVCSTNPAFTLTGASTSTPVLTAPEPQAGPDQTTTVFIPADGNCATTTGALASADYIVSGIHLFTAGIDPSTFTGLPGSTMRVSGAILTHLGNPMPLSVRVTTYSSNGGSFNPSSTVTDANGRVSVLFTAPIALADRSRRFLIALQFEGVGGAPIDYELHNGPVSLSNSFVSLSPSTVSVGGQSTLCVTLYDTYYLQLVNGPTLSGTGGVIIGAPTYDSVACGEGTAAYPITAPITPGPVTITVASGDITVRTLTLNVIQ